MAFRTIVRSFVEFSNSTFIHSLDNIHILHGRSSAVQCTHASPHHHHHHFCKTKVENPSTIYSYSTLFLLERVNAAQHVRHVTTGIQQRAHRQPSRKHFFFGRGSTCHCSTPLAVHVQRLYQTVDALFCMRSDLFACHKHGEGGATVRLTIREPGQRFPRG